ncbi:MAG: GntR family transcriptional regulator [Novosphingobium sp. 28-62-57]|nr:MAG: GntR family transcriptional regulator [Novosphingobium sp. 12-63-9]OYZ10876.1 MAG: GntR family transcriptional regulator [Novosphingobium sp. 28-62-57]OZA32359.1 MAG: GntR family transcriptional regulator [Novosphingobium sp. 17-62-9]
MDQISSQPDASANPRMRKSDAVAAIIETIESNIEQGLWKPGFRLPTERELELRLGVARNTLRKSLKKLEEDGKIVRQIGRGSFVAEPATSNNVMTSLLNQVLGSSPSEVMEIRLVLEPWAAGLAATRATAADLMQMRDCIAHAAGAPDVPTFEKWDGELHQTIISSAKNGLLAGLYEAINTVRHQPEWMKLKQRTVTDDRRAAYHRQHGEIVDALAERDPEKAARLIRDHLIAVRISLLGE